MLLVTSLGKEGFHLYGKRMLTTLTENTNLSVRVYTEDEITFPGAQIKQLSEVPGWQEFQDATTHIKPDSYHFNVSKFSHKVYAQLDAFESDHRCIVWLDADIVFKQKITKRFLKGLLHDRMCAYLGRRECYTETGLLIFDTYHEHFPEFKKKYREYYDKRYIFDPDECKCWIDCCAFDGARKGLDCYNLTPDATGMVGVFETSPLAPCMEHDKGNLKYGRKDEAAN